MSESATIAQVDEGLGLNVIGFRLMNNVRVYAIADKYDIPGLKEKAITKFKKLARVHLLMEFPCIICEIYDNTPANDRGLRDVMTDICAQNVRKIFDRADWSAVVQMRVEFTFDLLRAYATIHASIPEKIHESIPEEIEYACSRRRKRPTAGPRRNVATHHADFNPRC